MAESTERNVVGRIASGAFETVGRTESWTETRNESLKVVGLYQDLKNRMKPGDSIALMPDIFGQQADPKYHVKTIELLAPDGITAEMSITVVKCPDGAKKPYQMTWTVTMEEVQKRLVQHPMIRKYADMDVLMKWHETPVGARVAKDGDGILYYRYYDYRKKTSSTSPYDEEAEGVIADYGDYELVVVRVEGEYNEKYCEAVTAGIETYNEYLPVVQKQSTYLELPGVEYDADHIVRGGTISEFTGESKIGTFDEPDLLVEGYTSKEGRWFKSADQFVGNPDGSWTRGEGWTFTNDTRFAWIYEKPGTEED